MLYEYLEERYGILKGLRLRSFISFVLSVVFLIVECVQYVNYHGIYSSIHDINFNDSNYRRCDCQEAPYWEEDLDKYDLFCNSRTVSLGECDEPIFSDCPLTFKNLLDIDSSLEYAGGGFINPLLATIGMKSFQLLILLVCLQNLYDKKRIEVPPEALELQFWLHKKVISMVDCGCGIGGIVCLTLLMANAMSMYVSIDFSMCPGTLSILPVDKEKLIAGFIFSLTTDTVLLLFALRELVRLGDRTEDYNRAMHAVWASRRVLPVESDQNDITSS